MKKAFVLTIMFLTLCAQAFANPPTIEGKTWTYDTSVCSNGKTFNALDVVGTINDSWTLRFENNNFVENYGFNNGQCGMTSEGDYTQLEEAPYQDTLTLKVRQNTGFNMDSCYVNYTVSFGTPITYYPEIVDGNLKLTELITDPSAADPICNGGMHTHIFH